MPTPKRKRHWSSKHQFGRVQNVFSWEGGRECTFPPACRSRGAKAKMWKMKEIPLASRGGMPYIFFGECWCYISLCEISLWNWWLIVTLWDLKGIPPRRTSHFIPNTTAWMGMHLPLSWLNFVLEIDWNYPTCILRIFYELPSTHGKLGFWVHWKGHMDSANLRMVLSPHVPHKNACQIQKHCRLVVSNIFYFHPYLGKIPILTNIFQRGWNHQSDCH